MHLRFTDTCDCVKTGAVVVGARAACLLDPPFFVIGALNIEALSRRVTSQGDRGKLDPVAGRLTEAVLRSEQP
jgi:hypothetical protein